MKSAKLGRREGTKLICVNPKIHFFQIANGIEAVRGVDAEDQAVA
jgi:hypothetical protein